MVAAKAGRTMAGAVRAAAATAAVPETKRRLCKVILLGADPLKREGAGLTAPPLDTASAAGPVPSAARDRGSLQRPLGPAHEVGGGLQPVADPLIEGVRPVTVGAGIERGRAEAPAGRPGLGLPHQHLAGAPAADGIID